MNFIVSEVRDSTGTTIFFDVIVSIIPKDKKRYRIIRKYYANSILLNKAILKLNYLILFTYILIPTTHTSM